MSALPPEADMLIVGINVCYVPKADILQKQGARTLVSGSKTDRSTDIAGVRLVQKRTSRVPKHGPPGHTSCDGGMIRQSFW